MIRVALEGLPEEMFDAMLLAPCGAEYVHLVGVEVIQGDHVVEVGPATKMRRADKSGRGSAVVVKCYDEDGHTFTITFRFHKGNTYVARSACVPYTTPPAELWRD